MFQSSFNNKQLPIDWNYAHITALYKKGSRANVGNCRPISLTSIVCKLMESILLDNIMSHFRANMLFSSK